MLDFLQGDFIPKIPLDRWVDRFVDWAQGNLQDAFDVLEMCSGSWSACSRPL